MLFALPAYFLVFQKVCVLGFSQGSWLCNVGRDLLWKLDHIQFWEDSWGEDLEGGIGGSEKESLVRSSKLVTMGRQVGAFREIWEANYVQPLKCDCEGEAWREPHGKLAVFSYPLCRFPPKHLVMGLCHCSPSTNEQFVFLFCWLLLYWCLCIVF